MVGGQGLEMTDEKVQALKEIEPIKTLKKSQYFLGHANFYRQFIEDYSKIVLPLPNSTPLAKKELQSSPKIEKAQKQLIAVCTSAPVLKHFNPNLPAIV